VPPAGTSGSGLRSYRRSGARHEAVDPASSAFGMHRHQHRGSQFIKCAAHTAGRERRYVTVKPPIMAR
jgi:hypothetical protein